MNDKGDNEIAPSGPTQNAHIPQTEFRGMDEGSLYGRVGKAIGENKIVKCTNQLQSQLQCRIQEKAG